MQTYQTRAEVPIKYTWDLESIFAQAADWEDEFQTIQASLPGLEDLKGTLAESGQALLTVLRKKDEIAQRLERLYIYASLRKDEDTTNGTYQSMADRATRLYVQASTITSYIEPEILALSQEVLDQFFNETPDLLPYKHLFNDLRRNRSHVRSAEAENILAASGEMSNAPNTIYSMLSNADLRFPSIQDENGASVVLTQSNYLAYIRSSNRRVRQEAFESFHSTFLAHRHTLAALLSAQVKAHLFYAQQRNYATCRESALARYNIPLSVYDALIAAVSECIPLFNRYLRLRKHMLEIDELHMYDFQVPVVKEITDVVSYPQACEMIVQALTPLGESYRDVVLKAFSQRWIDVYETPGKRGGAYSSGAYDTYPFLLINWQDNYKSMYTLAHELGHCVHSYFTRANQPYHYGNYSVFIAEVASTLNEGLLTEYLLKHVADRATRLAILNQSLENLRSKLFRQSLSSEFEQQIHRRVEAGGGLTADVLEALYGDLNKKYYGTEACIDELIRIEWASIPHFYYDFYVYQYATGISAASALVQQILQEGQPAVKRYLSFLSAGSSDYSIELLKQAGVDMTTPLPVHQTLQMFESHLSQMEELYYSRIANVDNI